MIKTNQYKIVKQNIKKHKREIRIYIKQGYGNLSLYLIMNII